MEKLNAAIIGLGVVSSMHVDALLANKENIVALCDIVLDKANAVKEKHNLSANVYENYIEMLDKENIDVVHICTPHYLHAEMVIAALNRNINVICEKPLAISFEQLDDIEKAVKSSKAKLGVCMQRRFEPVSKLIKSMMEEDKCVSANGTLSWCRNKDYYIHDLWRGKKATEGGGVMINQALHTLDLVSYFMGYPDSVIAYTFNDTLKDVIDVEESAFGIFKYNDGRRFLIEASNANNVSHEIMIALQNSKHTIYYIGENLIIDSKQVDVKTIANESGKKEWGYGHQYLITDFYNCVREDRPFLIDFYEGSKVVRLILSMYASNGKEIKL
ncbi:MAG: Gfo/Idh/MocA family oxidoreductase [Bacilli bacterium]|nr:Gfo/Idh/MocA family oxidoreductase [Bacilli bacterium]